MYEKNQQYLKMMQDIYDVSHRLGIKTYIWGGFAVDILYGGLTREHGDLDGFTENLLENRVQLTEQYEALGYKVSYLEEFWMLCIEKGDVHAAFNSVKNIGGIAHWYHIGPQGTMFFPYEWLDSKARLFYNTPVYTCGLNFIYLLKSNVRLGHAEWQPREKDNADITILENLLIANETDKNEIKKRVWSFNPFWYAKGYEAYFYPIFI